MSSPHEECPRGDNSTRASQPTNDDQTATKQTGADCESSENHAVYAAGVLAYREAGWPGVIPAWGPGDKRPVRGFTGDKNYGVYPDDDQIVWWAEHDGGANLLIRVMPTLIGLDKDAYGDKTGDKAMVEAENRWGPLPADAWRSTSRIDCPNGSGIYLFKVPDGWRGRGEISFSELAIGDVEIIQHHHRTICAWPSVHPVSGDTYRWFDRNGELVPEGVVPAVGDHPELPLEWLKGLANTKPNRSRERRRKDNRPDDNDLPLADIAALLTEGRMTKDVAARFGQALYAITDGSDRHKSTLRHTLALLGMGAAEQAGVGYAVRELNKSFVAVVGPTRDHGENEADEEFSRMILGAGRLLDEGEEETELSSETEDPQNPATAATAQPPWSGPPPAVAQLRDILQEAHEDVRKLGVAGEETTVKSVFLAVVSRLLDTPVSVAVKGNSASGKSWVVKKVLRLFPAEAYFARSAMSSKALVYSAESYEHRMIVLYEVTGMRENADDDMTAYLIRTLLSEGRLDYEVTVKDPQTGNPTTEHIIKEGPTGLVFTTTQATVHHENETRLLSLNTDDSNEQTSRVMMQLASEAVNDVDLGRWHDLQHWLADDQTEKRVTIPFAGDLARLVPPVAVRMRRDFGAVLALVRTHAVLHQLNRSRDAEGRIVATVEEDYAVVRELVSPAVSQGVGTTVPVTVREAVQAVIDLAPTLVASGVSTNAVAAAPQGSQVHGQPEAQARTRQRLHREPAAQTRRA